MLFIITGEHEMLVTPRDVASIIRNFESEIRKLFQINELNIVPALSYALGRDYTNDTSYDVVYSTLMNEAKNPQRYDNLSQTLYGDQIPKEYKIEVFLFSSMITIQLSQDCFNKTEFTRAIANIASAYSKLFEVFDVENAIKSTIKGKDLRSIASKGGMSRAKKYAPIKNEIIRLLNDMRPVPNYTDINTAVDIIKEKAFEFSERHGGALAKSNFENILRRWMKTEPSIKKALNI